jgi:hypothetical protein
MQEAASLTSRGAAEGVALPRKQRDAERVTEAEEVLR